MKAWLGHKLVRCIKYQVQQDRYGCLIELAERPAPSIFTESDIVYVNYHGSHWWRN